MKYPNENFDEHLNAPVYFSKPYNRAYFDPNLLALPARFSDASLYKSVLEKIEEMSKSLESSFGDKVREVRKNLAVKLLKQNTVSISEIGFLLGFQEPASFHKAFKK